MRQTRGRGVEVDSLADFDRRLSVGATRMAGWHVVGLDLSERRVELRRASVAGALFLGCRFGNGDEESVRARGAVVFPSVPGVPVDTYRNSLYTPAELYDTDDYADSLDARAYAWSQRPRDRDQTLAVALHDHALDDALGAWVADRQLVGVMGGHALQRGQDGYGDAARLAHALGSRFTVATGGGPGAMEAANLGAYLAGYPSAVLEEALAVLGRVPSYTPDVTAWVDAAFRVRERWPEGRGSLGIPTWHYGHEPPNAFANSIAKYFRNAMREAILMEVCEAGIVFLPGEAGTAQEIFQDACENYYADESSVAPMVLVGRRYWTEEMPAWPLLKRLSRRKPMAGSVHLVDDVAEAAAMLTARATHGPATSARHKSHLGTP
ncbi:MAG: Rossmann fold nucleotide-binding protein [Nocardioidaceae bacterium]